ncbi:PEP-CTERM sorting domain-containing protein [Lentisalinibacter orientalis]|uniref:PEP-CTERM sorting domain-containing protein n=1 Tax=Lentisalinibacter orientalis TaxID=2992241 RepID=UPI003870CB1F
MKKSFSVFATILLFSASVVQADEIEWTDWQEYGGDQAFGLLDDITVTYTGDYAFVQTGSGTNFWTENGDPAPYTSSSTIDNAPTASEMVALDSSASHTITFSEAILDPIIAIVSLGRTNLPVSYTFDQNFAVLSSGVGYWGGSAGAYSLTGNTLTGYEFHGALQFDGLLTSISWSSSPDEYWHGITVGSVKVPEPSSLALLGISLLGLALVRRRAF